MTAGVQDADLDTLDPRTASKIMRKRQEEAERKERMFSVKSRVIGVDKDALGAQVALKEEAVAAERFDDTEHAKRAAAYDQVATMSEAMKAERTRAQRAYCNTFNQTKLRKECRREFHLSDPNALKRETLPDRDNAGASSLLHFAGEDLQRDKELYKKDYYSLQRSWIQEQSEEKALRKRGEQEAEAAYEQAVLSVTALQGALEVEHEQAVRSSKKAEGEANIQLANEKATRLAVERAKEQEWERTHVDTILNMPMLQDTLQAGEPGKDHKGLTAEQRQQVYDDNARQILEKKEAQAFEKAQDDAYDERRMSHSVASGAIEAHVQALEREKRSLLNTENAIIARAHREMKDQLRRTYANAVGEDYFGKFNTTAR